VLARLSRLLLRPTFREDLRSAETIQDVFQLIERTEAELVE
jgi:mannitol/fructose-specific phosphotransferase system IIA component (Ntr-type)